MKERILLSWSGGKDSALALHELMQSGNYEIVSLLTTVTRDYDRISMHGVRHILLEQQAEFMGLPLETVFIPKKVSNEEYESKMREVLSRYQASGIDSVAFGDIFLEDVRKYRETNLSKMDMKGIFPLWKRDTWDIARRFLDLGFKAIVTCVDSNYLDRSFAGKHINEQFLSDLPADVDPCSENGEFHSFVYDGPIFRNVVEFERGDVVLRDERFYYCDLIPV